MPEPLRLHALATGGWRGLDFEFFREGVEICRLLDGEPSIALLRYAPGAAIPRHRHNGLETVLILEGSQSDEAGCYGVGSLILNTEGYCHSVWTDEGCVALLQWYRPVTFLEQT